MASIFPRTHQTRAKITNGLIPERFTVAFVSPFNSVYKVLLELVRIQRIWLVFEFGGWYRLRGGSGMGIGRLLDQGSGSSQYGSLTFSQSATLLSAFSRRRETRYHKEERRAGDEAEGLIGAKAPPLVSTGEASGKGA